MKFYKYQALGNDYIVLNATEEKLPAPKRIERLCDRHFGVGGDGVLWGPLWPDSEDFTALALQAGDSVKHNSEKARAGLRIFNPDGSEAEKSVNGLRIFSRFLFDRGWLDERPVRILTLGGEVGVCVREGGTKVRVEMGQVEFRAERIPVEGEEGEVVRRNLRLSDRSFIYTAATVGNPHCVIPVEEEEISLKDLARRFGPEIERHSRFPRRVNVQFLRTRDGSNIDIAIWERGAGYTLASGSSAAACAAAAFRLGLSGKKVKVHSEGGTVDIELNDQYEVIMEGTVAKVAEGIVSDELWS